MPRFQEDDWSDSDDEAVSGVETSVLLGVPDGFVDVASDLDDAAVSRIGGHPVRFTICTTVLNYSTYTLSKALLLSRELPLSSSHCKVCSNPTELLVQLWCPFEDSPMDRALYIWGCSRTGCQGKEGRSVFSVGYFPILVPFSSIKRASLERFAAQRKVCCQVVKKASQKT